MKDRVSADVLQAPHALPWCCMGQHSRPAKACSQPAVRGIHALHLQGRLLHKCCCKVDPGCVSPQQLAGQLCSVKAGGAGAALSGWRDHQAAAAATGRPHGRVGHHALRHLRFRSSRVWLCDYFVVQRLLLDAACSCLPHPDIAVPQQRTFHRCNRRGTRRQ